MAKADPKIAIAPDLSLALDAVARLEKTSKRALVEDILRRGLRKSEIEMKVLELLKTMASQSVTTNEKIEMIADYIVDLRSDRRTR